MARDDAQLARKADMLKGELGLDLRATVARPTVAPLTQTLGASAS